MKTIVYSSNNSGGSFWLKDEDWQKLEDAGWTVEWKDERWLGTLATEAKKEFRSMRLAIKEFEAITGQDADDEGCNCCGQPHNFYEE
jgi:hypothetical protein